MRRPAWRAAVAAGLTVLTLGAAGCGDTRPVDSAAAAAPGPAATPVAAAGDVPELLQFAGRTLQGESFAGSSLAGRPALLWFWAPWCATCAGQASGVQAISTQYGARLGVLGVAGHGNEAEMNTFVTDTEVAGVTHLNDQTGEVWRRFKITEQSVFVLIDARGAVVHSGWLDNEQFPERVKALVG